VTAEAAKVELEAAGTPAGRWRVELAHGRRPPIDRLVRTSQVIDPGATASRVLARRDEIAGRVIVRHGEMARRPTDRGVTAVRAPITSRVRTATLAGAAGRDVTREPCPPRTAIVGVATTRLGHGPRLDALVGATGCRRGVSRYRGRRRRSVRPRSRLPVAFANHVNKPSRRRGNARSGSTTVHCDRQLARPPHAPSSDHNRPSPSIAFRRRPAVAHRPTWLRMWPTNSSRPRRRRWRRSTRSV
jgi:hypothetical protein